MVATIPPPPRCPRLVAARRTIVVGTGPGAVRGRAPAQSRELEIAAAVAKLVIDQKTGGVCDGRNDWILSLNAVDGGGQRWLLLLLR